MTAPPQTYNSMVLCVGCGFNVEPEDATQLDRYSINGKMMTRTCVKCTACPDMRESYRRGFAAGQAQIRERVLGSIHR